MLKPADNRDGGDKVGSLNNETSRQLSLAARPLLVQPLILLASAHPAHYMLNTKEEENLRHLGKVWCCVVDRVSRPSDPRELDSSSDSSSSLLLSTASVLT